MTGTPLPNTDFVSVQDAFAEESVQKSRFLAFTFSVKNIAEAEEKLTVLQKKYFDATHVCYALLTGATEQGGECAKLSDDGEPSGTAGQPILAQIRGEKLSDTLVAVVRYFGGVKLGTGGLIRTYGGAAAKVLKIAKRVQNKACAVYRITMPAADYKKTEKLLLKLLCKKETPLYNKDITFLAYLPLASTEEIFAVLTQATCGRVQTEYLKNTFIQI